LALSQSGGFLLTIASGILSMSYRAPVALIALLIASGCNDYSAAPDPAAPPESLPPKAAGPDSAGPNAAPVNLVIGDEKKLAEMVAAHKGKVVYVDFWATWCPECVEGFPHSVELAHKHKEKGLATIAVSFDSLENESEVREFLAGQHADFENLLSKYDGANQEAAEGFQMSALPQYRLYDRKGELRYRWEADSEDLKKPGFVEAKLEELLAEKAE
jgi:thiol-disulfide isomerase/thioredoxin